MDFAVSAAAGERLMRSVATALGRLRRSPGAGRPDGWVAGALRSLERGRPETFARLRRRTGFTLQLAEYARLEPTEQAAIALAVLFSELSTDEALTTGSAARSWEEYLVRCERWLAPGFAIAEGLETAGWGHEEESLPAVVARVARYYDEATLEQHRRPLQVLEELPSLVRTPQEEAVALLLLSEDGQELCDHHFRRHAEGYASPIEAIAAGIAILSKGAPRPRVGRPAGDETPVAPFRVSGKAKERAEATKPEKPKQAAKPKSERADNFQRRREALRSLSASGGGTGPPEPEHSQHGKEPPPTGDEPAPAGEADARDGETEQGPEPTTYVDQYTPIQGVPPEEEAMDNIRDITAARRERLSQSAVIARLEEIQLQFERIQRIAEEGERALATLAPQLHELTTWMSDLESMMERWRGPRSGSDDRAA
jgi:hypothetical protein